MGSALDPFLKELGAYQTSLEEGRFVWDRVGKAGDVREILERSFRIVGSTQVSFYSDSGDPVVLAATGEAPCKPCNPTRSFGSTGLRRAPSSTSPCPSSASTTPIGSSNAVPLSVSFEPSDDVPDAFSQFMWLVKLEDQLLTNGARIPHHLHELLHKKIHNTFVRAIEDIETSMPRLDESTERAQAHLELKKSNEDKKKRNLLCFVLFASVACVTETVGAFGDVYELIAHLGLHGIAIKIAVAATFALIYQTVLWAFDLHAVAEDLGVSYVKAPAHLEMLCEQSKKMHFLQGRLACQLDNPDVETPFNKTKTLQEAFINRSKRYQSLQEPSERKQCVQQFVKWAWIAVAVPVFAGGGFWEVYTTLHLSFMLPIIATWPPGLALGLCIVGALAAVGIFYALQQKEMTNAVYAFFGNSKEHKDEHQKHMAGAQAHCSGNERYLRERSKVKALEGEVGQLKARAEGAEQQQKQSDIKNKKLRSEQERLQVTLNKTMTHLLRVGGNPSSLFAKKPEGVLRRTNSLPSLQMAR